MPVIINIMSIHTLENQPPLILSFTSRDRVQGDNSSFVSRPLNIPENKYDSVCLLQASIPRSFYNVPANRNTFILEEDGVESIVTLKPASYNVYNIQKALSDAMTLASTHGWIYTVTYPACSEPDTFHFTFTVTGNGGIQPKIIFNTQFSMDRQLGFDELSTNQFVGDVLESSNAVNMSFITRAFIVSDIIESAHQSVLEEVLNYADYGMSSLCYFQQQDVDINSRIFATTNTNSWSFSLVDSFGQIIDLNNIPWSFSVVLFQRQNIADLQKLEMQIKNELRSLDIAGLREGMVTEFKTGTTSKTTAPQAPVDLAEIIESVEPVFPYTIVGSSVVEEVNYDFEQ